MTTVAVVPARGGSRGLPGKNLAEVEGISLVARAVRCGIGTAGVDEVVVSSDDNGILDEGRRAGATPLRRPTDLSTDSAPTREVVVHVLGDRADVDRVVVLQPTSPLRAPTDVRRCLDAIGTAPTATTISEVEHPVEWTMDLAGNARLDPILGWDRLAHQRQEQPVHYRLNGAVYASHAQHLRDGGALLDARTVGVIIPRHRAVDVDDVLDLLVARAWASQGEAT